MPKLPRVSGREIIRALERAGFAHVRTTGDHAFLVNAATGRRAVVPNTPHDCAVGTVANILRQAGLSQDQFCDLL